LEHDADSAIERIERRIEGLAKLKYVITRENAMSLVPLYADFTKKVIKMEMGLADFFSIVNT